VITLTLREIVQAVTGAAADDVPLTSVTGVSTDTRQVATGELFVALRGERFDGHDYVGAALERGAVAAVVASARLGALRTGLGPEAAGRLIGVDDPLAAYGRLAHYHRQQLPAQVVAVAGSNGKTTTKAMIAHVLGARWRVRASPKSFNNAVGVPYTLLSADARDDFVVVEIGTNAPGEVDALARLAQPDLGVITSLGEEHLEGLVDLEGVAAEECALLAHLRGGFAAVNVDRPLIRRHLPADGLTVVTFGAEPDADLRVDAVEYAAPWLRFRVNERFTYRLPMPGRHNAVNALGAIAVARRLGWDHGEIAARLEGFAPPPMRCELVTQGGVTFLNDAYNANPTSAAAALEMLMAHPCGGRRVVVFGEMRELGRQRAALHRQVAEWLRDSGVGLVALVGPAVELMGPTLKGDGLFGPEVLHAATVEACAERLAGRLAAGDVVLLKASRAVGLERLLTLLGSGQPQPTSG